MAKRQIIPDYAGPDLPVGATGARFWKPSFSRFALVTMAAVPWCAGVLFLAAALCNFDSRLIVLMTAALFLGPSALCLYDGIALLIQRRAPGLGLVLAPLCLVHGAWICLCLEGVLSGLRAGRLGCP